MRGPAWRAGALLALPALMLAAPAQAQLFPDNEARKAIVDLRTKVDEDNQKLRAQIAELGKTQADLVEQLQSLRKSLLGLNTEIEQLRADNARLRGVDEQRAREVAELQRKLADLSQGLDERLRRFEPQPVTLDGREFTPEPAERRAYDEAMAALRGGDFAGASAGFKALLQRYPASGYADSARFWLGNALYAKKDYAEAVAVLREFVAKAPTHPKAPEAMLAVANCQIEMKDTKGARATLTDLQKVYPKSEAATAAKERLAALK